MPPATPILLTVSETATILRVSTKSIYRWADQKQIKCVRLAGAVRFPTTEIAKVAEHGFCKSEPVASAEAVADNSEETP